MQMLYNIGIRIYGVLIYLYSPFYRKAAQWIAGRAHLYQDTERITRSWNGSGGGVMWFHCASLGEFEQGRPIMEAMKSEHPAWKLVVTFFSPSGYLIRKEYPVADLVTYLPLDTPGNVHRWVELIRPTIVFFIKYEYWFNMMLELEHRKVPFFFAAATFRQNMIFFRWYGRWFLNRLQAATWIFVQQESSERFLMQNGLRRVSVSGDTRFDRVAATAARAEHVPAVQHFCGRARIIMAGSSWTEEEEILIPFIREKEQDPDVKFIIAPHDVRPARIRDIQERMRIPTVCYSELAGHSNPVEKVLIIDAIGLLARLYRYAYLALIGGAFGAGLHNILEAVAFGVPVLFGPRHHRFWEAEALIREGGAWCIKTDSDFREQASLLLMDHQRHRTASRICTSFIDRNKGATRHILSKTAELISL
jgi:3-deoxy-D-manno-octulosonic-acid transferase